MLRRGAFFVRHVRFLMRSYHDDVPVIGTPQDTKSSTFQVRIIFYLNIRLEMYAIMITKLIIVLFFIKLRDF